MAGGVADFTRLLGGALAQLGADVHVLTSSRAESGASLGSLRVSPTVEAWTWRPTMSALRETIARVRPHVINVQYQAAAYGMHPVANALPWLALRVPCVATFHDLLVPYLFPKAGRMRWWANLALARGCRAVIVTNEQDRVRMARYRWIRRLERIPIGSNIPAVLPPGFDRDRWRRDLAIPDDALVLCYFGFLNASKGGEELVEALAGLRRRGYNVRLLMIGETVGASDPTNRLYCDRVKDLVRARGVESDVLWTGYLTPQGVSSAFASADVCVLPYRDGASLRRGSLMAALAHGMAIVTTHPETEVPELIQAGNVLLAPPRSPESIVESVARLADDLVLRQRLRRGAVALSQDFNWRSIAARTLEVYHAVAGS